MPEVCPDGSGGAAEWSGSSIEVEATVGRSSGSFMNGGFATEIECEDEWDEEGSEEYCGGEVAKKSYAFTGSIDYTR